MKKPYQFELTVVKYNQLKKALKAAAKLQATVLDCILIEFKSVTYGAKLTIFLLGASEEYMGPGEKVVNKEQWEQLTTGMFQVVKAYLGDNIVPYIEEWTTTDKFSARFETYIHFIELPFEE